MLFLYRVRLHTICGSIEASYLPSSRQQVNVAFDQLRLG